MVGMLNRPISCGYCDFIFPDPYQFDGPDSGKEVKKWRKANPEKIIKNKG